VGKASLDDYSVIGKDDPVRPVFLNSVVNDPDVTGLLVYLQTPEGQTAGEKVYYLLKNTENPAKDEIQSPAQGLETSNNDPEKEEKTGNSPKESLNPAKDGEIFIQVPRLDKNIPVFPFPENLKIGGYSLVFEVLGEKQTLYRTERRVYYIADAKFTLDDIQSYLPGVSAGSYLIPPGLTVMLDVQVTADERLEPFIVWYDGKQRITEGRIADGAGRLFWEAPDQTGFHTIRAELFPFNPAGVSFGTAASRTGNRSSVPELRGKVKELALPVSAKGAKPAFFVPGAGEPLHWYQFAGNLRDSMASGNGEWDLARSGGEDLRWAASEGIYGLSVKAGETYQVPFSSFALDEEKQGGGAFLLRVKPTAEGTLFTASFKAAGFSGDALTMSLVYRERSLQLILEAEGLKAAASLPLGAFPEDFTASSAEYPALRNFITVEADFYLRKNVFTAALSMAGDGGPGTMRSGSFPADSSIGLDDFPGSVRIELSRPLSGEISCRLGTPQEQMTSPAKESRDGTFLTGKNGEEASSSAEPVLPVSVSTGQAELPALSSAGTYTETSPLAIFDEFATIFPKPLSNRSLSNR
jgi:hypothetical protein